MYPCDPWETCTSQLSETAAAATAPAATAGFSTPAPLPARMLVPVLQGLNRPSVEEQRALEYSIKLKEYEIQLQQLRILQTQLQEAAAQCMAPKHAPALAVAAPCKGPIHMHPAPGTTPIHMHGRATPTPAPDTAPIHVLAVPTGPSYSPSFPPGTVPSYDTISQGYDTSSPSYDTSSPRFSPSSPNFLPTSPSYDPSSPI